MWLLLLTNTWAGNLTYCVGGYNGSPPNHQSACGALFVAARHLPAWHPHSFVMKDGVCYECYDEIDDSCDTDFLPDNPAYRKVDPSRCPRQDNPSEVVSHVISGTEVAQAPREDCGNGLDDDGDGRLDCEDPECGAESACIEVCADGFDNDRDGKLDCDDDECRDHESCGPLGISLDLSGLPDRCWVDSPCQGAVRVAVAPGPRQAEAQALVEAAVLTLTDRGETLLLEREVERVYSQPEGRVWTFTLRVPGEADRVATHPLAVAGRLVLRVPEVLDFGEVDAGTPTEHACVPFDLSGSEHLGEHFYDLVLDVPDDLQAHPVLAVHEAGRFRTIPLTSLAETLTESEEICLEVPLCAGEVSPPGAALRIVPTTPEFASEEKVLPLVWEVRGTTWVDCNRSWLIAGGTTMGLLWFIAGVIRPQRFSDQVAVAVHGDERRVRRAEATRLVDCRGARSGLWRNARLGLHADGFVNGRLRGAAITLHATRRGLVVRGPLEMLDPRKRTWSTPEDAEAGHAPTDGTIYRCGELYFRFTGA